MTEGSDAARIDLPPHLRRPRLRRPAACEYLSLAHGIDVSPRTLAKWDSQGLGPERQVWNRTPFYPVDALDRWVLARLQNPRRVTNRDDQ